MDNELDNAFKTLIELMGELRQWDFSRVINDVYEELLSDPTKERTAILRAELRSSLVDRPGGIMEMYIPNDGKKTQDLIDATHVVKSFARRRLHEFIFPPPKIPRR